MKKFYFVFLILVSQTVMAQNLTDLFSTTKTVPLTWLGVDYSHVKIVGDLSSTEPLTPTQIRDWHFPSWNKLILAEPDKFDIKGMLKYTQITNDIDMITKLNAATVVDSMQAVSQVVYSKSDIMKFVSQYDLTGKTGFGVVFIAENLDKAKVAATYHVVIMNMATKDILITERIRTEPAGFGIRNYWAGSIYKCIVSVKDVYYKKWKATYAVK